MTSIVASTRNAPIGIFDSGVGGLTVLREIKRALPGERLIYLGDTARLPWGTKSPSTIRQYAQECARFLEEQGVKLIVVACNTASSVACDLLKESCHCPVVGVIEPAAQQAVELGARGRIGIIGTEATVRSNSYVDAIRRLAPQARLMSMACPLFVPLVEEGIFDGPLVEHAIDRYLSSMRSIETVILACTHYPLLRSSISAYLGSNTQVIDCGAAVAAEVKRLLESKQLLGETSGSNGRDDYFVTDMADRFEVFASSFLKINPLKAVKVHAL